MWHFVNCTSSPEPGAESSADSFSAMCLSAPSSWRNTLGLSSSSDSGTESCPGSPSGMTSAVDVSMHQCKIGAWTKNTDMAKSANALSAARRSSRETREASSNAARTLAVVFCKQGKRHAHAPSVGKNSCHLAQATKHAPAHAERLFVYRAGSAIQWSKYGTGSPFSAALSSQDACGTRPTERRLFSGIPSRNCGRILSRISSRECHGATTGRKATNGA